MKKSKTTNRIPANQLREGIIAIIIENAQIKAATGPVVHEPFLDVDLLGVEFDRALDEINEYRFNRKMAKIDVDATFRQAVIDTIKRRAENSGRMMIG